MAGSEDPVMKNVRSLCEKSRLSLHDLGLKMGCVPETARQSVSQFLRTNDPHISILRRFADAMGITIRALVWERHRRSVRSANKGVADDAYNHNRRLTCWGGRVLLRRE